MDTLFRKHDRLMANTSMKIIREKMNQIHWNAQIICIMGPKGVGKSSLLQLREGDADLSRRAIKYIMPGLSFREALKFYHGLDFPKWTLEDILSRPYELWEMVTSKCKPIALFKEYLEKGQTSALDAGFPVLVAGLVFLGCGENF